MPCVGHRFFSTTDFLSIITMLMACCAPLTSAFAQGSDSCETAQPIAGEGSYDFDTSAATTDGLAHPICGFSNGDQIDNDVWFLFTAQCNTDVTVSTCGDAVGYGDRRLHSIRSLCTD